MNKIIALLLCVFASTIVSAKEVDVLVVELLNGTVNRYALSEKPVVSFPDDEMVISSKTVDASYMRSEVKRFYFETVEYNDINAVDERSVVFNYVDKRNVVISGLECGTTVSIVSVDGKKLLSMESGDTGSVSISMCDFPEGVYIISFGDRNVKINLNE